MRNSLPKKHLGISNPEHLQKKDVMISFYESICGNDDGDAGVVDTEKAVTKDGNKWRRMCRSLEQLCHQGKSATKDLQKMPQAQARSVAFATCIPPGRTCIPPGRTSRLTGTRSKNKTLNNNKHENHLSRSTHQRYWGATSTTGGRPDPNFIVFSLIYHALGTNLT